MATTTQVGLDPALAGIYHAPNITLESARLGSRLLQQNHDAFDVYYNDEGFHNHVAHHLLTLYALGATPVELQQAFDSNKTYQRPHFPVDSAVVRDMANPDTFNACLGQKRHDRNYELFFGKDIDDKGWEAVLNEHVFARTAHAESMFVRLFAGFLHPLIHLGFGVEFRQPAILVEALAQAATHDAWIGRYLQAAEDAARRDTRSTSPSLVQLIHQSRQNDKLRGAAHWDDSNKIRDGIMVRAADEMASLAAQWTVRPEELEAKTAEMINASIYVAGASQCPTKQIKFDFYFIHCVNSSIFFSTFLREPWLSTENKCRLLEWKGRLDLAMYVSRSCPELLIDEITGYAPKQPRDGWAEIGHRAARLHDDDGHASKLVRAIASGQRANAPFEQESDDVFPIKGDMWLQLGHMAIDSVEAGEPTWVRSAGFAQAWDKVPPRAML